MKRFAVSLSVALCLPLLLACLWDDDTLRQESNGMLDVIRVVTGRFERNPPLYYEMRVTQAQERISENPDDLEAYDNAAVACDRLGRGDEAIAWMDRKLERLDLGQGQLPESTINEHRYRYLANQGTFWVHRWARNGADRTNLDDVRRARDYIAEAIKLNPDAHFGREIYQLKAIEWILDPPTLSENASKLQTFVNFEDPATPPNSAVRGLTGLIALGNAWESVDVFNALALALEHDGDRSSVAELARLRCYELIEDGKRSMLPEAPSDPEELKRLVDASRGIGNNFIRARDKLAAAFTEMRAEADVWHEARTAFLVAKLEAGQHPDTDPSFWSGYKAVEAPPVPEVFETGQSPAERERRRVVNQAVTVALTALFSVAIVVTFGRVRKMWRKRKSSIDAA